MRLKIIIIVVIIPVACVTRRCACVSQVAIGLASCCALTAGPILSEAWFPANQRTTATAIGTIAGYLGVAGAFLFGEFAGYPKL